MNLLILLLCSVGFKTWDEDYKATPAQAESLDVELVGWVDSVGVISSLAASGDGKVVYASAGDSIDSLVVIDISDPTNPRIYQRIGHDSLECNVVTVLDSFLYVMWTKYFGIWVSELWVMDIRDPLNPVLVNIAYHYESHNSKEPLEWWKYLFHNPGDTIFYATGGLKTFDISDPLNPSLISYAPASTWAHSYDFPFPYSFHISNQGPPYDHWEVWDLSDPANMFLVHEDSVYQEWEYSSGIAAWQYNGRRYLYLHGGTYDYSFDVTNLQHPVRLNWGARDPRVWVCLVRDTTGYGVSSDDGKFIVLDLTDPVHIPTIAWCENEPFMTTIGGPFLWVNGYVVTVFGSSISYTFGLAIFHYLGDSLPGDTTPEDSLSSSTYLSWIRTVYNGPGISFCLKKEADVSIRLFNSSGQRVYSQEMGHLEPGVHTVKLPAMKAGVYIIELRLNQEIITQKIIFSEQGGLYHGEEEDGLGLDGSVGSRSPL